MFDVVIKHIDVSVSKKNLSLEHHSNGEKKLSAETFVRACEINKSQLDVFQSSKGSLLTSDPARLRHLVERV